MGLVSVLKQLSNEENSTLYVSILFGLIIITMFLFLNFTRTKNNQNLPPCPPKLPFIGNLHQLGTLPHRSFHELSKKHGPLMLLELGQVPTLVVSSADVAREIIKNYDVIFSDRPQTTAANIFTYGCKDVGFVPYGEEWRQKRRICVLELLSVKRVRSFCFVREQEVAELVGGIRESCVRNKGSCVNLSELLVSTSNNIVSRCILGQKYNTPKDCNDKNFGELGRKLMRQFSSFSVKDFFPSFGWIDSVRGLISDMNATSIAFDSFLEDVIEEHIIRRRNKEKKKGDDHFEKKDFVDILVELQENNMLEFEDSQDNFKAILVDMFVGGSDTFSTTLEWTFAELLKNPKAMKKAQEEVRRVVGRKSKVEENDVNQMNYLNCVIKETLRLHPPLPLLIPRQTTSSVKVQSFNIPPKTRVFINAWAIQRDPKLWEEAEEFIPERFENNQVDIKGLDFQLIPFGVGRRGCPGISFGLVSTGYVLANLLYWFDWKLHGEDEGDIDMDEMCGLTVSKKVSLHLQPIPYSLSS
ncbi:cytochrome P450 71A1-like [Arachis ipaensis]|uniref:cytochrome P450 71A1-like n=1 Tax=Arachis ipaensis TaxID=130454 RepID=UPI0007AFBB1C|nr:cytochrome P450 71A1-like [Arachis ipaensis]XP_025641490.1 cytochrome P450 71A1 [Arachis hypogaea]QHN98464.1 Cytochrome P450 [Arachis hypogaea]